MVGIVGGNGSGLLQGSAAGLGQRGNLGQASQGAKGSLNYVNVSNGNLVVQDKDVLVQALGEDLSLVRTYNSQGRLRDDNNDNWWASGYQRLINLTGTLNTAGSSIQRVAQDGSVKTYYYNSSQQSYLAPLNLSEVDSLRYDATQQSWTWANAEQTESAVYQANNDSWRIVSHSDKDNNSTSYSYTGQFLSKISDRNGSYIEYVYEGDKLVQEKSFDAQLSKNSSHTYYQYDEQGRLSQVKTDLSPDDNSISDGKVYVTTYRYVGSSQLIASVQQSDGSQLSYTYLNVNGEDRVETVTDALGRVTRFSYDLANRSTVVTDAYGNSNTYVYDAQGRFVSITGPATLGETNYVQSANTDKNNSVTQKVSFTYNAAGQLETSTNALGFVTTYAYNSRGQVTRLSDSGGKLTEYRYTAQGDLASVTTYQQAATTGQAAAKPATVRNLYDDKRNLRFEISAEGSVVEHKYNAKGQRAQTYRYAVARYPLAAYSNEQTPGLSDLESWAAAQDKTQTSLSNFGYNLRGQVSAVHDFTEVTSAGIGVGLTRAYTAYTYDASGNLLTKIVMRGDVIENKTTQTNIYDGLNRLLSSTNALGQTEFYAYDDANQTVKITQKNGRVDTRVYDKAGQLTSELSGGTAQSSFVYDQLGRLAISTDPTGVKTAYVYDYAGNLRAEIRSDERVSYYGYNALGQRTRTSTMDGTLTKGLFQEVVNSYTKGGVETAAQIVERYQTKFTPNNGSARYSEAIFDEDGRQRYQTSLIDLATKLNGREYRYDVNGNLIAEIFHAVNGYNANLYKGGAATAAANTALAKDRPWVNSPDDRIKRYFYNLDGQLIGQLDADGFATEFKYSANGNLIEEVQYKTALTGVSADASFTQLIASLADPADTHSYHLYDGLNQRVATVDKEGYLSEWTYDREGRLTQSLRYSSKITATINAASTLAQLRPATNSEVQVESRRYDQLGRLIESTDASGSVSKFDYDGQGNLASVTTGAGSDEVRQVFQRYDSFGRVIARLSGAGSLALSRASTPDVIESVWTNYATRYTYDAVGRKTSETDSLGFKTVFYYDQVGNLVFRVRINNGLGEVEAYKYDIKVDKVNNVRKVTDTLTNTNRLVGGLVDSVISTEITKLFNLGKDSITTYDFRSNLNSPYLTTVAQDPFLPLLVFRDSGSNLTSFGESDLRNNDLYQVRYEFNKRGLLISTTLVDNKVPKFITASTTRYDAFGRVESKTDARGIETTYQYDKLGQVVEISDPARPGSAAQKTTYDAFGRVLTQTDAAGQITRYSYDTAKRSVTITSPEGVSITTVKNRHGQVQSVIDGTGVTTEYQYDNAGNLRFTRVAGAVTENRYDQENHLLKTIDANGNAVSFSYDAAGRMLTRNVELGGGQMLTTRYEYDAKGQKLRVTDPNGVVTRFEYNLAGQLKAQIVDPDGAALATRFTYDQLGNTLTVTDPAGKVTRYVYDGFGRRSDEIIDDAGLKLKTHYEYDANNNVICKTDANDMSVRFAYDEHNRQILSVDSFGRVTRTRYDAMGRVLEVRLYSQSVDIGNLGAKPTRAELEKLIPAEQSSDQLSLRRYNKDGQQILEVNAQGEAQGFVYDQAGRVIQTTRYATRLTLPLADDVKLSSIASHPGDRIENRSYNALGQLAYTLDATGKLSQYEYDKVGNLICATAFATRYTEARTSVLANLQSWAASHKSVDDRSSLHSYNAANQENFSVDEAGKIRFNEYKGTNLLASTEYAGADKVNGSSADAIYAAIKRDPAADRTEVRSYNPQGQLAFVLDASGKLTQNEYDKSGNLIAVTEYASRFDTGRTGNYGDLVAWANGHRLSADRTTRMAYDNANRLVYSVDAEGYVSYREYQGTRLVKQTQYATAVVVASADLATIRNTVKSDTVHDRVSQYRFDAAGNLLDSTDGLGYRESYTYNALGQKTSFTNKNGATWNYEYDQAGRLVKEIAPAVEVSEALVDGAGRLTGVVQRSWQRLATVLEYDALGNLSKRTEAAGSSQARSTRYDYDAQGRQIASYFPATGVYNPATNATELVSLSSAVDYDALGNATRNRDVAGNYSYKVYDAAGRVQYDIDAAGFVTEYKRNAYGEVIALTRYDQSHSAYLNYDNTKKQLVGFYARPATGSRTLSQTYDQSGRISQVSETLIHGGDSQGRLVIQSKVTDNRYNAFGELVSVTQSRTERQNDGSFIKGLDAVETRYAYDHRGQKVASLDAENYLTVMRYDGVGNLSEQVEFAERYQGAWDETGQAVRGMALKEGSKDRGMRYEYDANGRKLSESRLNAEFAVLSGIGRSEQNQHGTVLTRYAYDHLGNQILSTETEIDATRGNNSSTAGIARVTRTVLTSYDVLGRVLGKVEPGSGNDNKGVYSRYERDAYGNAVKIAQGEVLVQNQENGPPKLSGMVQLGQQQSLQAGEALYSANGRYQLLLQTDGNLVIYDSVTGTPTQPTAIWQSGTGAGSSGAESLRLTMQDDGNLVLYRGATALWSSQTQGKGMMLRLSDAGQLELRDDAGAVRWTSSNAAQTTGKERVSTARYNQAGKLEQQLDALNQLSRSGYDVYGNQVAQFKVVHKADGGLLSDGTTALVSMRYDHAGRLIESTQQTGSAQSEASTMSYRYNGYGELVEQRVLLNGQWQSLSKNDYDETGQVWRSRAQDGVTHLYLRDYLGRVVRDISSQSLDLQTVSIPQLSDVASNANYISTVIRYNKLGQVTERSMPSNGAERQLTVTSVNHRLSYDVVGNVTSVSDTREESQPEFIEGSKKREGSWIGQNSIRLSLPDTGNWGDGDLRVSIVFNAGNIATPQLQQIDRILSVHAGQGDVTISWPNQSYYQSAAQDQITQISLAKKDSSGNWVTLGEIRNSVENGAAVAGATNLSSLHLSAPNNLDLEPVFEFRQIGSSQWESGRLTRFGKDYAFNPIQGRSSANPLQPETLAEGQYEYKMVYRHRLTGVLAGGSEGKFSVGYESERLEAAQLFVALYNRGPIASELENMATRLKSQSLADVAEQLLNSPPLAGKSAGEILSLVYRQAQGREPDQAGLDYWLKQWSGPGPAARGSVISDIIRNLSGMQQSDTVALNGAKLFNNKVQVALTYAWQLKGSDFTLAAQALGLVDSNGISQALALLSTRGVITQAEQQLQITQFYLLTHDRVPEAAGMEYFLKELKSKPDSMEAQLTSIFNQSGLASLSAKDLAGVVLEQRLQWTNPDRKARLEVALSQAPDASAKMRLLSAELSALQADSSGSYETESAKQRLHNRTVVGLLNAAYLKSNAGPDAAAELTQKVTAGDIFSALSTIYQRIDKAQFKQMQISQAYTLLLNRAPEKEGYVFWQNQMQQDKKKQADLLNAIITDVLSSLTPKQLLQDIYSKVLGPANYTVSDDNYWLGELTRGNKGEVLSRLLDELQNWKPGNHVSEEQAQLFQLKNAYALIVANLGGDFQSSTRVFSSAQQEVNAMRLLKNVEVLKASEGDNAQKLLQLQLAKAETEVAAKLLSLQSAAAELAYQKTRESQAYSSYLNADLDLQKARDTLNKAESELSTANAAVSKVAEMVEAAKVAVANANARVQIDNSIENQVALEKARIKLNEARYAEASAKSAYDTAKSNYDNKESDVATKESDRNNKLNAWQTSSSQRIKAQSDYDKAQTDYTTYSNQVASLTSQIEANRNKYKYSNLMINTVKEVQQVYRILLQRDGDLNGMLRWLGEYTTREDLFKKVIADPSSGVQYLSSTTLFTRIYTSALHRNDNKVLEGINYWAPQYENAVGFEAKAHICETFLNRVLAETTGPGDDGRRNLQYDVDSATESARQRWVQDYQTFNLQFDAAQSKMNAADEARRRAQNTLNTLPNSSQAEQAYRDADALYQRAAKEWGELRQKKETAERTYNTAAGAASTAQGDYNRLNTGNTGGSAGNSDNLRIIASQARVAAEQARTLRDNAQAAVDNIQANLTGVRQITELYTLLFNRSNPLPTHLHYWLTDLKNGTSLNEIAYSMYIDPNVLDRQLSSMGVDNFFKYIYEETLQRKDNDVKGWTHWVERFNAASTPAEKGNVIIGLIGSVKNDPKADGVPEALAARARFNQRVDSSVYDAVKNAQSYANTSDENYRRLNSQATVAEANYNASIGNNTTLPVQTGNDMLSLVQVYRLLGGSESVTNATAAKLNDLVQDVRTGRKKINLARAELFRISAYAGLGSSAVLSSIYQNALGRSDNDMGGYWLPELDNARLTNNDEQLGQVLFNIVDKLYKEQIAGTPGFAGRKNFDAAVVRTLASLSSAETSLQSQALSTQSSLQQQVATAKAAVSALNGGTNPQLANAVKAFSLSTAVNVEASAAETLIARVYALVLNRAVDEAGLAHWAAKAAQQDNLSLIRDILSGAEARGELAPMGSAEFVDRLYQALGSVDANNSALHKAGLANGSLSRELVVQRVLDETLKNQASDIKGIQRQNMLVNKTSVALIYSKLMHGSGELNQARTVLARVSANDSAAGIASALASDPKVAARSHLAGLYQLLFGRTADLKGFIYWGKEVPAAGLEDASWSSFITKLIEGEQKPSDVKLKDLGDSAFINQLYRNALGREAEPAGLAYWIQSLQSSSRADVVRNFLLQLDYAAENANPDATVKLNFKLDQQVFSRRVASNLSQLLQEETSAISNLQQGNDNQLKDLQKAAALAASQASVAEQQVDQVLRQIGAPSWAASVAGLNLSSRTQLQSSQIQQIAGKDAIVIQERYDRWGNLLSQSDARYAGWQTSYRYDDQNRLIETVRQDGVRQTQAYNSLGQQIGQLDGNNNLNLSIRDAQGHLVRETHGDGSWINYRYNGFGELQEKQDAAQTIRYAYDDLGRLVQQTHMGVISVSEVASTAMHKGYAESYALPEKAQLQQRFVYDELGRRTEQIQEMLENGTAGNIVKGSQISQRTVYDLLGNAIEQDNSWHTRGGTANKTSRRFDALGREISRTDANTKTQSWSYDGTSARYKTYTDLGAHGYAYDYNFQGLLSKETGTVNSAKSISYTYTAQGQVSTINDAGTQTVSLYQYDEAGRRISEYVLQTQSGVKQTLQDNRLGYDEVGRLRVVETSRYRQEYGYDNNDNRVLQITGYYVNVREQLPFNGATSTPDKNENAMLRAVERRTISWNTYDAMNRQLIVDGIKIGDVISISGSQGHELAYDAAGRKVSDRYAGKTLDENAQEGMGYITEITDYDQLGRIKTISRDGLETGRVVIDEREYNQHNQLVRSGMNDAQVMKLMRNEGLRKAYEHIGVEGSSQLFSYSASTIASEAHLDDVSRVLRQQIHTTNQDQAYSNTMNIHDDAGNLIEYGQDGRQTYYYTYNNADQYDHYQNSQIRAVHRDAGEKTSTMKYDANGHLQSVDGAKEASIQYWTDTAGRVLRKQQGDTVTTTLLVNEQILGSSSEGLASVSSSDDIALFYRKEGIGRTSVYEVREGDSLTSIALSLYGDRSLWYKLAEANGLGAESQLSKGTLLQVPALEGSSNKAGEIKPYNSSKLIGDTNPEMPQPQNQDGGCGPVGAFLSAATFIALSFIVPGGGGLLYQAFTQAAIGAASSLVGQIGAVAAGEQKDINWKGVALSGISAGVSAGLGPNVFGLEAGGVANAMAKAAVTSTITQGIGVVTGLQPNFSWRGVAAAAVGAGVGHQVGGWLNKTDAFSSLGGGYATAVAQRSVSNFAEGVTTSLVRNGRVDVGQVAADAFGNALGSSLAALNTSIYTAKEAAADFDRESNRGSWQVPVQNTPMASSTTQLPYSDYDAFLDTPEGREWSQTGGKLGYGLSSNSQYPAKGNISDTVRAETMIRLQKEAQEFKAKNPRLIGDDIYVDGPDGRASLYVEIWGTNSSTLPDIQLNSPSSMGAIISRQGQPTVYNEDTGTMGWAVGIQSDNNPINYRSLDSDTKPNVDIGTRLQGWADSMRSNALYTASVLYDTKMRFGYMDAIHRSADNAVATINKLGPNNLSAVEKVARQASAFRDATRTATQSLLTPWGEWMSQKIEGKEKISFEDRVKSRESKLTMRTGVTPTVFETYRGVAAGSGYSNPWVTGTAKLTRLFGPAMLALQTTMVVKHVVDAAPGDKMRVGVSEASGLTGGLIGGALGASAGVLGATLLLSTPVGWAALGAYSGLTLLGASFAGGAIGGAYGGSLGREYGDVTYRYLTK